MHLYSDRVMVIPGFDSLLFYYQDFFSVGQADFFFEKLLHSTLWNEERISFYGKSKAVPRLTSWHSKENKSYSYSGVANCSVPYTAVLSYLHFMVENFTGWKFNSVLLNLYRDGNDSMGWHADDESSLDGNASIASLSFGISRDFQVKPKDKSRKLINIKLDNGSLLLMKSPFQESWLHRVPKRRNIGKARVNLTFRKLL